MTTWMILKDNTLSEITQFPKDKYCVIPVILSTRMVKFIKTEAEWLLPRAGRRE